MRLGSGSFQAPLSRLGDFSHFTPSEPELSRSALIITDRSDQYSDHLWSADESECRNLWVVS